MMSVAEIGSEKGTSGKMMNKGKGLGHQTGGHGKVLIKCQSVAPGFSPS